MVTSCTLCLYVHGRIHIIFTAMPRHFMSAVSAIQDHDLVVSCRFTPCSRSCHAISCHLWTNTFTQPEPEQGQVGGRKCRPTLQPTPKHRAGPTRQARRHSEQREPVRTSHCPAIRPPRSTAADRRTYCNTILQHNTVLVDATLNLEVSTTPYWWTKNVTLDHDKTPCDGTKRPKQLILCCSHHGP